LALAIVGFGARVPIALVLGWVFVRRGSIYASIGLHAAFNGILIVLADAALRSAS
jgi:membrane protease YdiL (CAAX protease family)